MRLSVKTDIGYQLYEQQRGVVIGDNFLTREDFEQWFKDLLHFSESDEFKLFEIDSSFSTSNINLGIKPNDDMNIGLSSSDNITIQYLDGNDRFAVNPKAVVDVVRKQMLKECDINKNV